MAELEIRLDVDPNTGKRNVTIKYRSDDDALPMEHEDEHRRLVDRLIEGGTLKAHELGSIRVERMETQPAEVDVSAPTEQKEGALLDDDA